MRIYGSSTFRGAHTDVATGHQKHDIDVLITRGVERIMYKLVVSALPL